MKICLGDFSKNSMAIVFAAWFNKVCDYEDDPAKQTAYGIFRKQINENWTLKKYCTGKLQTLIQKVRETYI